MMSWLGTIDINIFFFSFIQSQIGTESVKSPSQKYSPVNYYICVTVQLVNVWFRGFLYSRLCDVCTATSFMSWGDLKHQNGNVGIA
uniref:Putative secreted protein n=1 Tax=Ixodes ricinus TaxID=34613 RepID=A0A6B0TYN6_IXORI